MRGIQRSAATAMIAIAASTIATATASAQPAVGGHAERHSDAIATMRHDGVDHGVSYTTGFTPDGAGVATTVAAGRFAATADGRAVTLTDPAGAVITTLPTSARVDGRTVALRPTITGDGRTLVLTPVAAPGALAAAQAQPRFVDYYSDLARHQYNAGVGALIGLGIGILIGGFGWLVGAIPGAIIGAGIGALIGWSLP
jgi:hypothetical protein